MVIPDLASVIIPAYNAEVFIDETIQSVLNQTYNNIEIIVVNDGSTDRTKLIIDNLCKSNKKIRAIHTENAGVSAARNKGIENANGEYIAFLDADDFWLDNNLEKKIVALKGSQYDYSYSDAYDCDESLNIISLPKTKELHILENLIFWEAKGNIPGPSSNLVLKRSCFDDQYLMFSTELSNLADHHFCVLLASSFKGFRIQEPLWKYRILPRSMSKDIKVLEHDAITAYRLYDSLGLFNSTKYRRKAFASMYLMLAGSWWREGGQKLRGINFMGKAFASNPLYTTKWMFRKIR